MARREDRAVGVGGASDSAKMDPAREEAATDSRGRSGVLLGVNRDAGALNIPGSRVKDDYMEVRRVERVERYLVV